MSQDSILQGILKDTNYQLDLFADEEIATLTSGVTFKERRGERKPHVECIVRGREIVLTPEEVIRQLFAAQLIDKYKYSRKRLRFEHSIHFGRSVKRADIVIMDKDRRDVEYIIVELKNPKLLGGKKQLKSYCNATGAPMAVWTNGSQVTYYQRKDPNYFEEIPAIPNAYQKLADILSERFTWRDLVIADAQQRNRSLKARIEEMEDEVLANAGVDVFEEVFKLIFTKLYDEHLSRDDKTFLDRYYLPGQLNEDERTDLEAIVATLEAMDEGQYQNFRDLEFRNSGQTDAELRAKIEHLFAQARRQWAGVFPEQSSFELTPSHLSVCVSSLQPFKLFDSNLQVIDEAFEYLVNKSAKGEKGQYFTPRHVIDMCVRMLNPKRGEYMIDPACGSCGFPVHTIFWITGHLFENAEVPPEEKDNVLRVFGIDFDKKVVRVARALNLIAGDGEANVLHLNTLDYIRWDEVVNNPEWRDTYGPGFRRLEHLRASHDDYRDFRFDLLMANPPFAGDIKETRIIHRYDLGFRENGKPYSKLGRDILFIERNLDFLKPGGRMAIVLPQGRFNNTTDRRIRDFITERCRILAVVGLHPYTFKPHAGTKTSVLLVQKWDDQLCPHRDDYPIFFAVSDRGGKDTSGEYVYAVDEQGRPRVDKYGHYIVDHDLHNHGGELRNGIAEMFIEFAKRESLSFWKEG